MQQLWRGRSLKWSQWAGLAGAGLLVYLVWLVVRPAGGGAALGLDNLVLVGPGFLAAYAVGQLRRAALPTHTRRLWTCLGLALWMWTGGSAVWTLYAWFGPGGWPLPSFADIFYLAGHLLAVTGLFFLAPVPAGRLGRFRYWLDMFILASALALLGWLLLVQPLLIHLNVQPGETLWLTLYTALDLALLIIVATTFLALPLHNFRWIWGWVGSGVAALAVADMTYTYLGLRGLADEYRWFDAGRWVGLALLGLGALHQRTHLAPPAPRQLSFRWRLVRRAQLLLPAVLVLVLGWYVAVDWQSSGQPNALALGAAAALAVALVARQGVVAGEIELRQYAQLVNSAAEMAFICAADGRLQLVNPALLTAAGYAQEDDLVGRSAFVLMAPGALLESGLQPEYIFKLGLAQGWSGEVVMRRRDGSRFPAYLSLRPVPHEQAPLQLAATAHDLTETKQRQADLQAAQAELEMLNAQLEQKVEEKTRNLSEAYAQLAQQHEALQTLDRLKSEFVSLVSHELRAPLTNIAGGIELMLMRLEDFSPRGRETLALVQRQIRRLAQFVETILDISALEAGRLPLQPTPLDLRDVLATVRLRWAGLPSVERLQLDLPADLPLVLADERGLTSVLFHLMDNALKYAVSGTVTVAARPAAGRMRLAVMDQGPGIPPEAREAIFDKFQRLNSEDARPVYGHGLGLYMARRLLEAMDGEIKVEAGPAAGACFVCWLPLAPALD